MRGIHAVVDRLRMAGAIRRCVELAAHVLAHRDGLVGVEARAPDMLQATHRLGVVLGQDDARAWRDSAQRGDGDAVIGRTVHVHDVERMRAQVGTQLADGARTFAQAAKAVGKRLRERAHAGQRRGFGQQAAAGRHGDMDLMPSSQRARQLADVGGVAAAAAAVEIGVEQLHRRAGSGDGIRRRPDPATTRGARRCRVRNE